MADLTALALNVPFEALLNRTACLVPNARQFATDGTWTKPAHAKFVEIVAIGPGFPGANRISAYGAGGGCSGRLVHMVFSAANVPDTLAVDVGSPSTPQDGATVSGTMPAPTSLPFLVSTAVTDYTPADGGTPSTPGQGGTITLNTYGMCPGSWAPGGRGGAPSGSPTPAPSEAGVAGRDGYGGPGGAGGASTTGGSGASGEGGVGYGAGGGGAGGASGAVAAGGGGGGGGGYGSAERGNDAVGAAGGLGAPGYVVITTWCGVDLR